jgi:hypothetical protein
MQRSGGSQFKTSQEKNFKRPPVQPIKSWVGGTPVIPATAGSVNRRTNNMRIAVQASWGINARPYLKNNQSRKGWECGSSGRVQGPDFNPQYH